MNEKERKERLKLLDRHPLGLGCWAFGGRAWGGQAEKDSVAVMEEALERGICHFDTAQGYADSENIVGRFVETRRKDIFLASKVFPGKDPDSIRTTLESSLKKLRTDYLDLYYIHWPRAGVDTRRIVEQLALARDEGLIGAIGVSNFSVSQLEAAREVASIDFLQVGYHLFWRSIEEELVPYCREKGIGIVSYSSLGQGILTGKFGRHPEFPQGDHRSTGVIHFREDVWPHVYAATERLKPLAERAGRPLAHLALQWCASRPGVRSVLAGARNRSQMAENAAAMAHPVDPEILEEMTAISDGLKPHLPKADNIFDNAF
jgi:aryl-alcohol dehydrogenase-like predicted oxidoreductase